MQGEVVNDHGTLMLKNTNLSAVLFDAAGNVLGGATGLGVQRAAAGHAPGLQDDERDRLHPVRQGGVGRHLGDPQLGVSRSIAPR